MGFLDLDCCLYNIKIINGMDKINVGDSNQLTHKIIGCAMQVHHLLGNGFQKLIYQRALAIEMHIAGLEFEREKENDYLL